MKEINRTKFKRAAEPHVFMTPSYLLLIFFIAYPLLNCIRLAFLDYKLTNLNNVQFAWFANFEKIFADPDIGLILMNSFKFVVITVALQFILGMALALLLKKPFKFKNIYQGIVFIPWAFSSFIVGLTFQWLFNGEYGPINDILMNLGWITEKIAFMSSETFSLWSVIIALVWSGIPFFAIMMLAALQSIPGELYEAATIDGCGTIKSFFHVTLPYIKPTIVITLLLRSIWVFNNAELIFVMTKGGPANSSHTLASYMFTKAYSTLDFGMASAIGVLFMLILVVFVLVFFKLTKFNEGDENK